jgi:hypothetical protein
MKKFFKGFGIVVVSLLVLLGLAALYFSVAGIPSFETKKIDMHVDVAWPKGRRSPRFSAPAVT